MEKTNFFLKDKNKIEVIEVKTSHCKTLEVGKYALGQRRENDKLCLHQARPGELELPVWCCGEDGLELGWWWRRGESSGVSPHPEDSLSLQATMSEIWASYWIPSPHPCLHPIT